MTKTVSIQIPFSDDDVDMHIIDSGFTSYQWWHQITFNGEGWTVEAENPYEYTDFSKTISYDDIRNALAKAMVEYPHQCIKYLGNGDWDIDADGADIVMQIATFGKVIYG